ncbi:MAG: metal-dependent phosphohydrolase [Chloroflexi bacterium]|nr:metal-dependent phosphohydrolase [Chloroflexota bacterium]
MSEYDENWMTTYTGKKFHYLNPQPDEIDIKDIAHHLSLICRFTGASRVFYSVAEHSVRVARLLPKELQLAGLLHDAAEAYINDISRPVKYSHKLEATEKGIILAIDRKFGVETDIALVKEMDSRMLATEARDLLLNTDGWAKLPEPLSETVIPWTSALAESRFLSIFDSLRRQLRS